MAKLLVLIISMLIVSGAAEAADAPKGLWLITDYPATTARAGETTTVRIKIQNTGLAPERVALTVSGVPAGWKTELVGGGSLVRAAMPGTNDSVSLELRILVPAGEAGGSRTLTVDAKGATASATLPIEIALGTELPAKIEIKPKLPSLRGTVRSNFDYEFSIKNDSGKNLVISLAGQAPRNFQASFTENFGSQEISSIPIDAGQSKDLKFKVKLPTDASAGDYDLSVAATADGISARLPLKLEATGQPKLRVSAKDERLSAQAEAGASTQIDLVISNEGSASAENIELSATPPSGWKIEFEQKKIDRIAPGEKKQVAALLTPSAKAIAGDYMSPIRATASGESSQADFRIGVTTSTLWGVFGVGIIAIALLVLIGAVMRFGRR